MPDRERIKYRVFAAKKNKANTTSHYAKKQISKANSKKQSSSFANFVSSSVKGMGVNPAQMMRGLVNTWKEMTSEQQGIYSSTNVIPQQLPESDPMVSFEDQATKFAPFTKNNVVVSSVMYTMFGDALGISTRLQRCITTDINLSSQTRTRWVGSCVWIECSKPSIETIVYRSPAMALMSLLDKSRKSDSYNTSRKFFLLSHPSHGKERVDSNPLKLQSISQYMSMTQPVQKPMQVEPSSCSTKQTDLLQTQEGLMQTPETNIFSVLEKAELNILGQVQKDTSVFKRFDTVERLLSISSTSSALLPRAQNLEKECAFVGVF